jgi:hypothetical protein
METQQVEGERINKNEIVFFKWQKERKRKKIHRTSNSSKARGRGEKVA